MPLWNPAYVGSIWLRKERLFANQNVILFFENKMKVTGCVEAAVTQKCLQIEKVLPVQVGKSSFINHLRTELYYGHLPNVIQANANCILCRETCVRIASTPLWNLLYFLMSWDAASRLERINVEGSKVLQAEMAHILHLRVVIMT